MCLLLFFFKQKTAYELRISDWSSDVCSSDLPAQAARPDRRVEALAVLRAVVDQLRPLAGDPLDRIVGRHHAGSQAAVRTDFLAPAGQPVGAVRRHAEQQVVARYAGTLGPVEPVLGMVLLDPDIAHQPAAGLVVARAAAIAGQIGRAHV